MTITGSITVTATNKFSDIDIKLCDYVNYKIKRYKQ